MKRRLVAASGLWLFAASAWSGVEVYIQDIQGVAWVKYECTAGEMVRAFALDVSVDRGQVVAVSDFFRGESTATARGYGIFPAAFRDHIAAGNGTNVNWNAGGYTPLAVAADRPGDTLPGLNSSGVTLEFGALWDPGVPSAIPPGTGTLCALRLNRAARVSIAANPSRGGVISASSDAPVTPSLTPGFVSPASILSTRVAGGTLTIAFEGGELESALQLGGLWTSTGNTSGTYTERVAGAPPKFFRVRALPAVVTSATLSKGMMTVTFRGGELEAASTLTGPWTGTGNTRGTYTETSTGKQARFFRVRPL